MKRKRESYRIEDCSDEDGPDWRVFNDPYGEIGIFSSRAEARKFVAGRRGDDRWIDEGRWT